MKQSIDIILPNYNNGIHLRYAILSILRQTHKDFQIIVIDDGSTDDSLNFLPKDSRIKIIQKKHSGLVDSLNTGIENSQSNWVARMDGDDIMHPQRLEIQIQYAINHNLDWVSCCVQSFQHPKNQRGYPDYLKWHNTCLTHDEIIQNAFIECPLIHPTWLMKRSLFEQYGLYKEGTFPEDYEFFLRTHRKANMGKVNQILHYWRDSPKRLSRTSKRYSHEAFRTLKTEHFPLKNNEQFVIFGAGKGGRLLTRELKHKNVQPKYFVDISPKKYGKTIYDISIISMTHFLELSPRPFAITAVMTKGARGFLDEWFFEQNLKPGTHYLHFH